MGQPALRGQKLGVKKMTDLSFIVTTVTAAGKVVSGSPRTHGWSNH
jgi:hypothetical protein